MNHTKIKNDLLALQEVVREVSKYDLGQLVDAYEYLITDVAKFKVGDIVALKRTPNTDNGWSGSKHFLVKGQTGVVHEVLFSVDAFRYAVLVDNQSWKNLEGEYVPTRDPYLYTFSENYLKKAKARRSTE